jgi:hypothetical protein
VSVVGRVAGLALRAADEEARALDRPRRAARPSRNYRKKQSMVCELATRTGGASTVCSMPVASTTLSFRVGVFMIPYLFNVGNSVPKTRGDRRRAEGNAPAGPRDIR